MFAIQNKLYEYSTNEHKLVHNGGVCCFRDSTAHTPTLSAIACRWSSANKPDTRKASKHCATTWHCRELRGAYWSRAAATRRSVASLTMPTPVTPGSPLQYLSRGKSYVFLCDKIW